MTDQDINFPGEHKAYQDLAELINKRLCKLGLKVIPKIEYKWANDIRFKDKNFRFIPKLININHYMSVPKYIWFSIGTTVDLINDKILPKIDREIKRLLFDMEHLKSRKGLYYAK